MYKNILLLLICSLIMLTSCSQNTNIKKTLPDFEDINDLPTSYTLEDAKLDGCVVFEDLTLISGEANWKEFLDLSQSDKEATIRIVTYYSDESTLYIRDLSFDGSYYYVTEKYEESKQYRFLNHYTIKADNNASYKTFDYYILVNEKDVSFDSLERSMTSSKSDAYIDQYRIYINQIQ